MGREIFQLGEPSGSDVCQPGEFHREACQSSSREGGRDIHQPGFHGAICLADSKVHGKRCLQP